MPEYTCPAISASAVKSMPSLLLSELYMSLKFWGRVPKESKAFDTALLNTLINEEGEPNQPDLLSVLENDMYRRMNNGESLW